MKQNLFYESPIAELLQVELEKNYLGPSQYDPNSDGGSGRPPQGSYGGSYGEFE